MPTAKTGYVNGSDLLILVDGKAIGHCTSHSITCNSETKDRAVKPVASAPISAGLWKNKGVVGLSISIKADGLSFYTETEAGYATLLHLWNTGQSVTVKATEREGDTNPYLQGSFVITNLEQGGTAGDDATYTVSLENDGAPTVLDATKITGYTAPVNE